MKRQQRRINKEDIGKPSNFRHVEHIGFGPKPSSIPTRKDSDLGSDMGSSLNNEEKLSAVASDDNVGLSGQNYPVERRNKASRSSLIPRHHRSTTTCIFPPDNPRSLSRGNNSSMEGYRGRDSIESPPDQKLSLKPTFGSLLNLSFLPLGMGKSSSKSPSIGKTKRMSLLNLTAGNLFASPKATYEENRESVHMTSYTRRRSLTNSNEENDDNGTQSTSPVENSPNTTNDTSQAIAQNSITNASTRIPLAKLGRSKSSMSEFSKRPKLRLKILPPLPPVKPPRITSGIKSNKSIPAEALPSPPPSPIPSPPPSPVQAVPFIEEMAVLRSQPIPRPRIIPLPSTGSVDSVEPVSPQYLTPAGGCSPVPNNNDSPFPSILSPTIPPSSTPFFPARSAPGTPPVWPLQPVWPTTISMQSKEASIPEIPSPCREEMEISENEYEPVVSIVESFLSNHTETSNQTDDADTKSCLQNGNRDSFSLNQQSLAVTSCNINSISSVLRENVDYTHWPRIAEKLFYSVQNCSPNVNDSSASVTRSLSPHEYDIYECLLEKTLELWSEKAGDEAVVDKLMTILNEENQHQATESLQDTLRQMKM